MLEYVCGAGGRFNSYDPVAMQCVLERLYLLETVGLVNDIM